MGLYLVLGLLFVMLVLREIGHGPGILAEIGSPSEREPGAGGRGASGGGASFGGSGGVPHTEIPSAFSEGR
jgi:hypothetical protein